MHDLSTPHDVVSTTQCRRRSASTTTTHVLNALFLLLRCNQISISPLRGGHLLSRRGHGGLTLSPQRGWPRDESTCWQTPRGLRHHSSSVPAVMARFLISKVVPSPTLMNLLLRGDALAIRNHLATKDLLLPPSSFSLAHEHHCTVIKQGASCSHEMDIALHNTWLLPIRLSRANQSPLALPRPCRGSRNPVLG
jgi:hypothetical protein